MLQWEGRIESSKFYDDTHRYEVDVDAMTGEVTGFEQKGSKNKNNMAIDSSAFIVIDSAKKIALESVGISEEAAVFTKAETEREKGILVYEIEFVANGTEYEYEIDAKTGAVLEFKFD